MVGAAGSGIGSAAATKSSATGRSSRTAAATTEAAASHADSNDSATPSTRSGCAAARLSNSTTIRGRLVSTFSRTISSPTRALVRQCTRRNSSPTTYSRNESKVIEPCGTASTRPSRLRPAPVGTALSGWMRGCTHTGTLSP